MARIHAGHFHLRFGVLPDKFLRMQNRLQTGESTIKFVI